MASGLPAQALSRFTRWAKGMKPNMRTAYGKNGAGGMAPKPEPPWLAGAAIGLAILGMAGGAMVLGAGLALCGQDSRGK